MENTVRQISRAVREYYVDEALANLLADKIDNFIGSPRWISIVETNNMQRLIRNLNSIITSVCDDVHFNVSQSCSRYGAQNRTGIWRYTPNYISIGEMMHLYDPEVRKVYSAAFAQFRSPLLIDLRNCVGGSSETVYLILSHFFDDGEPLFEITTRTGPTQVVKSASVMPFYNLGMEIKKFKGEIKVMVNGATASAAEMLAFILQRKQRAKIYGSRTMGANHITQRHTFDDIDVYLPYAKMCDVESHSDWENTGIVPDYGVETEEYIRLIYMELTRNAIVSVE